MKLIAACVALIAALATVERAAAAVAGNSGSNSHIAPVGLYAPDRYDGIPDMCLMPMDFGYCRAKVKRYYFDMRRMKCSMFYWGGCAGNINNFKSLDDCNKNCLDASYEDVNETDNSRNYKNNLNSGSTITTNNNNNNYKVNSNYNSNNNNKKPDNRRIGDSVKAVDKNHNFEDDDVDDETDADYGN